MIHRMMVLVVLVTACAATTYGQITSEVLGAHDLTPQGSSPVKGGVSASCLYCHAPHSGVGGSTPLWNQTLSTQTYTPYGSTTYNQKGNAVPLVSETSTLCLSCHDGTVAPGLSVAYGNLRVSGAMNAQDVFGTNLQGSHPFSLILPIKDAPDLVATVASSGATADPTGAVKLVNGNIECTTCHNAHVQSIDKLSPNFLVKDGSSGQLCFACHDPGRVTVGQTNALANWRTSVHAIATNTVVKSASVGNYPTVAKNACDSCHQPHNAPGAARLLRGLNEQDCVACHSGGGNVAPTAPNVFAEYGTGKIGHPFPAGNNTHDAGEAVLLNQNRHATCVDCHESHSALQVASFPMPPVLRVSQAGSPGISATDGTAVLNPAVNAYENCLRCHGTSVGKNTNIAYGYLPVRLVSSGDPLNVIPEFVLTATSSHPVMHVRNSAFPQPSLLSNMLNSDGVTQGRSMGTQMLCTDCHNSDDNREFGGAGPNGPHGSKWSHILERRYEFSRTPVSGQLIINLFPTPDLSVNGPYALCGKCHDLLKIVQNSTFSEHARHINDGFSCSACHVAHGMGAVNPNVTGERLVNFDVSVVARNGALPITYNRAKNSCTLTCHNHAHG